MNKLILRNEEQWGRFKENRKNEPYSHWFDEDPEYYPCVCLYCVEDNPDGGSPYYQIIYYGFCYREDFT